MAESKRYARSFYDALSLARNRCDQATIYYFKDGIRAVYEATTDYAAHYNNTGTIIIRGRSVTSTDVPDGITIPPSTKKYDLLVATNAIVARKIFDHNGIDTSNGWDLRP